MTARLPSSRPQPRRRRVDVAFAGLALALTLAACSGNAADGVATPAAGGASSSAPAATSSSGGDTSTPSGRPAVGTTPAASAAVPALLQFTAPTVAGGELDARSLAGRRTVFWFWAPWCTICARSAPGVAAAAAQLGDAVRVIGVAGLSSDAGSMSRFVQQNGVGTLTNLADTGGDVFTRFGVTQQDTFVLVDETGKATTVAAYGQDVDLPALVASTFR